MTFKEYLDQFERLLDDLNVVESFTTDAFEIMASVYNIRNAHLNHLLISGLDSNVQNTIQKNRTNLVNNFSGFIESFDLLRYHKSILQAQNQITTFEKNAGSPPMQEPIELSNKALDLLNTCVDNIWKASRGQRKNEDIVKIISDIEDISTIHTQLVNSFHSQKNLLENLENQFDDDDNWSHLQIQIHDHDASLETFILLNNALADAYNSLITLYDINDFDLQIVRIESGSLFQKVLGNSAVNSALSYLFKKCIDQIFRKYTSEGRLTTTRELLDAMSLEIDFRKKCEEVGLQLKDKEQADASISAAHAIIAKNILNIASKTSKISINDETLEIKDSKKKAYFLDNLKQLEDPKTKSDG